MASQHNVLANQFSLQEGAQAKGAWRKAFSHYFLVVASMLSKDLEATTTSLEATKTF